jgi:predicted nicotinamide N-methyase
MIFAVAQHLVAPPAIAAVEQRVSCSADSLLASRDLLDLAVQAASVQAWAEAAEVIEEPLLNPMALRARLDACSGPPAARTEVVGRVEALAALLRDLGAREEGAANQEVMRAMNYGTTARGALDEFMKANVGDDEKQPSSDSSSSRRVGRLGAPSMTLVSRRAAALGVGSAALFTSAAAVSARDVIDQRCQEEQAINGAYLQACIGDSSRTFEWPSPVGRIIIEQGTLGPSNNGEVLWNGAQLLADYEARELGEAYFKGKRVVELGCGTALPSIVAAKLNAANVVATDGSSEALTLAKRNVAINFGGGSGGGGGSTPAASRVSCQKLAWTASGLVEKEYERKFDVVLASDVLWVLFAQNLLAATAKALLAPGGEFLLCETGHDQLALPAALDGFRSLAEGAGLRWEGAEPLDHRVDGYESMVVRMRSRS